MKLLGGMEILKENPGIDPVQSIVALAIPVLLGSPGRIPLGMFADRYGGRLTFSIATAGSIAPEGFSDDSSISGHINRTRYPPSLQASSVQFLLQSTTE